MVLSAAIRVTPPPPPSSAHTGSHTWTPPVAVLPERAIINDALRRWKELDVELTEASNEV